MNMVSRIITLVLIVALIGILAVPCPAQRRLDRDLMDAQPSPLKSVVPWLIGLLLIVLASLVLFKKSKRAGYQDR